MANEIAVGLAALTETLRQQNEDAGKRHEELVQAVKKDKEDGDNGNGGGNGGGNGNGDNGGNFERALETSLQNLSKPVD